MSDLDRLGNLPQLAFANKASGNDLTDQDNALAQALAARHGDIVVAKEASGLHFYMACPCCLQKDGASELSKRHLAVNVDKYFRRGKFSVLKVKAGTKRVGGSVDQSRRKFKSAENSAMCMKRSTPYKVADLLKVPPLQERGIPVEGSGRVQVNRNAHRLICDDNGVMIPEPPGVIVPITSLPREHPAVQYLLRRRYDLSILEKTMSCSFCVSQLPVDRALGRFYKRLPYGFCNTPQNRIIFFANMFGSKKNWQARVIDFESEDGRKFYLHPYRNEWVHCESKNPETGKYEPTLALREAAANDDMSWDLAKYQTAPGGSRRETLMGLDAAIAWNRERKAAYSVAVCVEGPLDVGRFGPPCVGIIGKRMSDAQAAILSSNFSRVLFCRDKDAAGQEAEDSARAALSGKVDFQAVSPPDGLTSVTGGTVKDIGDMLFEDAVMFLAPRL